jgi:hypothetical protein
LCVGRTLTDVPKAVAAMLVADFYMPSSQYRECCLGASLMFTKEQVMDSATEKRNHILSALRDAVTTKGSETFLYKAKPSSGTKLARWLKKANKRGLTKVSFHLL